MNAHPDFTQDLRQGLDDLITDAHERTRAHLRSQASEAELTAQEALNCERSMERAFTQVNRLMGQCVPALVRCFNAYAPAPPIALTDESDEPAQITKAERYRSIADELTQGLPRVLQRAGR